RAVKTFSIGFDEEGYDEAAHARTVARALGTDHHEIVVGPDVLADLLDDLAWYLDEPSGDASAIPTWAVSRLASEHVKVVLSGDGGDEIFAGYDKYRVERRERLWRLLPAPVRWALGAAGRSLPEGVRGRNFLRHLSLTGAERYADASTLFRREERQKLLRPEVRAEIGPGDPLAPVVERLNGATGHWLSALQELDVMRYLPLDILAKVDRMSMAHSIESRVPLLDHKLVEFAARIPPELNLRGDTTKYVFKRAMKGLV